MRPSTNPFKLRHKTPCPIFLIIPFFSPFLQTDAALRFFFSSLLLTPTYAAPQTLLHPLPCQPAAPISSQRHPAPPTAPCHPTLPPLRSTPLRVVLPHPLPVPYGVSIWILTPGVLHQSREIFQHR